MYANVLTRAAVAQDVKGLLLQCGYSAKKAKDKRLLPILGDREYYALERYSKYAKSIEECIATKNNFLATFIPHLAPHLDESYSDREILSTIKAKLTEGGLNGAGWKYLLKLPAKRVLMFTDCHGGREGSSLDAISRRLQAFCEIASFPKDESLLEIVRARNLFDGEISTEEVKARIAIVRAAFKESDDLDDVQRVEFIAKVSDVLDWVEVERPVFDKQRLNATFKVFSKLAAEWHTRVQEELLRNQQVSGDNQARIVGWETPIATVDVGAYKVQALTNSLELRDEGKAMGHCVGTNAYDLKCLRGDALIFGIRNVTSGARISTLELVRSSTGEYTIAQNRGYRNANVTRECMQAGIKVRDSVNELVKKRARWLITESTRNALADANNSLSVNAP